MDSAPRSGPAGPSPYPRSPRGPQLALLAPPILDAPVVAGEQDVGHAPAAELGRPRVVRILEPAVELGGEALDLTRLVRAERARQAARDRVHEHHRRQLAAGEDVRANRDRIRRKVRHDALVEPLEPR